MGRSRRLPPHLPSGAEVEGKPLDLFRLAYHGETKGIVEGGHFRSSEVYLAHDLKIAENYAEGGGTIYLVEYLGSNPLLLDTPEKFVAAWTSSGADQIIGNFHPDQTGTFVRWAREIGYDAIVVPESAFEGELGYEMVAGTLGEPQTIVLYPHLARIIENCTGTTE